MTIIMNLPNPVARRLALLFLTLGALLASLPAAAEFVVEDIRVEGAQNIEVGTIFNYLPIKVGDAADGALIDESIKTLFATGLFQDVEIRRENSIRSGRQSLVSITAATRISTTKRLKPHLHS